MSQPLWGQCLLMLKYSHNAFIKQRYHAKQQQRQFKISSCVAIRRRPTRQGAGIGWAWNPGWSSARCAAAGKRAYATEGDPAYRRVCDPAERASSTWPNEPVFGSPNRFDVTGFVWDCVILIFSCPTRLSLHYSRAATSSDRYRFF